MPKYLAWLNPLSSTSNFCHHYQSRVNGVHLDMVGEYVIKDGSIAGGLLPALRCSLANDYIVSLH
jgi:hypothetical protein